MALHVTKDPDVAEGSPGFLHFCFVGNAERSCSEPGLDDPGKAEVIAPLDNSKLPLLVATAGSTIGNGNRAITVIYAYRRQTDRFEPIFSQLSAPNNNEEIRVMTEGPLAGTVIVASEGLRAPFGYGIAVYRLSRSGRYGLILKFTGRTRYGDGNPIPVIDSEMAEIERRLHLWNPGDPLPIPQRTRCATLVLKRGVEWCEPEAP